MNPTRIGDISEAKCLALFLAKDWEVSIPFGHGHAYDLVIDRKSGKGLERVQVKTARYNKKIEAVVIPLTRSVDKKRSQKDQYRGQADLIAAYCPKTQKVFVVELADCKALTAFQIRIAPTKNGQRTKLNLAEDYEIAP